MTLITGGSDKKRHKRGCLADILSPCKGQGKRSLLLRTFRVLNERAIRVDDVAVVVRGWAADDGGLSHAVLAVGLDHVGLRRDGAAPGSASGETVLEGGVPAVVLRELLDVGGAEIRVQVSPARAADGRVRGARRVVLIHVRRTRFPRRGDAADVGHGPLLLRALHGSQQIGNRDGRENADDCHDDQQLDQGEAFLILLKHEASLTVAISAQATYQIPRLTYICKCHFNQQVTVVGSTTNHVALTKSEWRR